MAEILDGLAAGSAGPSACRAELLLRVLIEPLLIPARRPAGNTEAVARLALDLSRFQDPLLRARILALLPDLPDVPAASVLMRAGRQVADRLAGGSAAAAHEAEAAAFLEAAQRLREPELGEICTRIAENAASPALVRQARRVARVLLVQHQ